MRKRLIQYQKHNILVLLIKHCVNVLCMYYMYVCMFLRHRVQQNGSDSLTENKILF